MMSSDDYGKFTEYGIHIAAERYFWAANHLFVLLSSLIGDNLILYASFQEDALKLNKFIVSVLQHIAVSDLLLASLVLSSTRPSFTSRKEQEHLKERRWKEGMGSSKCCK